MKRFKKKWVSVFFVLAGTAVAANISQRPENMQSKQQSPQLSEQRAPEIASTATNDSTIYNYVFDITHPASTNYAASTCEVDESIISKIFGRTETGDFESDFSNGTIKFYAIEGTTGKFNATKTANGASGQWFNKDGDVCTWGGGTAVMFSEYNYSSFSIGDYPNKVSNGEKYVLKQALVKGTTVLYFTFNITIGDVESVKITTQPDVKGDVKTDSIAPEEAWIIRPFVQCNEQPLLEQNYIQVNEGDNVTFTSKAVDATKSIRCLWYRYNYNASGSRLSTSASCTLKNVTDNDAGSYYVIAKVGTTTRTYYFFLDVQTEKVGTKYLWKEHTPYFSYNFKSEYPNLSEPQNVLNDASGVVGRKSDRWWTCVWGKNRRSLITDTAIVLMLKRFNTDFAYIRDEMGWPPDKRAKRGYKSGIYVYGSGMNTDDADSTAKGGWQGSIYYAGENWPMVFISYYPIYCFDPKCPYSDKESQCSAMIHEGIHSVLADMPGCKQSAWFQEGGNTWLQSAMETKRSKTYGAPGFLDGGPFLAPFMPIECYSGWLNDGSFGGPSAEGVNMYNGGQQICTWRNYLGGVQYGNSFPIFLGEAVGDGAVPWIWRYSTGRVLEGIGDSIGDAKMRLLILQYRAKQATYDIGGWAKPYRSVANSYFGVSTTAEWSPYNMKPKAWKMTPYVSLSKADSIGWMRPDTVTNPGWSGGNQIPLHVTGDTCTIDFLPKGPGMMCQLCYRTQGGNTYYSQPVHCGTVTLAMPEKPANGVVFAVVANTDWIYVNDNTRKKHHDYRVRLGKNVLGLAATNQRWYLWEQTVNDPTFTGIKTVETASVNGKAKPYVRLNNGMLHAGDNLNITLENVNAKDVRVHIFGLNGMLVGSGRLGSNGSFRLPTTMTKGLWFIDFMHNGTKDAYKVLIE